jgi:hypothetical protein
MGLIACTPLLLPLLLLLFDTAQQAQPMPYCALPSLTSPSPGFPPLPPTPPLPQRDASSPFHVTPYQGKYPAVPSTPDALHLQKVLAGCADRGASTTVVECDPSTVADGRCAS